MTEAIQSIIDDLKKIPKEINTIVDIKKLTEEVSKRLQKDLRGRRS